MAKPVGNVKITRKGKIVTMVATLDEKGRKSHTGRTQVLAATPGPVKLPGRDGATIHVTIARSIAK